MLSRLLALPILLAATAVSAQTPASDSSKKATIDGVAAIVGNKVILISDVALKVNAARADGQEPKNAAELAAMQKEAVDKLIEEELLVQKALIDSIVVNDVDINRTLDEHEKRVRSRFPSDAEFRSALRQGGFATIEEWRRLTLDQIRRTQLQRDLFQKLRREGKLVTVNPTEKEINEVIET
jgi:peptidyl-prolyl cis-trans isomerase SurA